MMIYNLSDVVKRDRRAEYACVKYILEHCCKIKYVADNTDEEGESWAYMVKVPMDFMQLKWILDRSNFLAAKWYGLVIFNYDMLWVLEDADLIPETFDCDWGCTYDTDSHGYFKMDENNQPIKIPGDQNLDHMAWLSIADKKIMNKVIRRWKIYGRFFQSISNWWWHNFAGKKIKCA